MFIYHIVYLTSINLMFGIAMKFFQTGIQPINIFRNSDVSNNKTRQQTNIKQPIKELSKSSQNINSYQNEKPIQIKTAKDNYYIKNGNKQEHNLKESRIRQQDFEQVNIEQLKQSQQKVLQDFKRSISKSLYTVKNINNSQQQLKRQQMKQNSLLNNEDRDRLVSGLVLSRIQELSQQYLEYSFRKQDYLYNKNSQISIQSKNNKQNKDVVKLNSNNSISNKKEVSCELIKSIVRSVLLQSGQINQQFYLNQYSNNNNCNNKQDNGININIKSSLANIKQHQNNYNNNYQTYQSSNGKSFQVRQQVTQFIKDLFSSLGLLNEQNKQLDSIQQITSSAKMNFNLLKGNDYISKLHQMLHQVNNIDNKFDNKLENKQIQTNKQLQSKQLSSANKQLIIPNKQLVLQNKQVNKAINKSILIKRQSDKKVKLISPQTFSQLQSKRLIIQKQIYSSIQLLTKTKRVKKYSFYSNSVNQVYINFSMDFKFMSYKYVHNKLFSQAHINKWIKKFCSCTKPGLTDDIMINQKEQQQDSNSVSILNLTYNLVNVSKGIKTRNFIKYEQLLSGDQKQDGLHEDRCLSMLFKNRTYDLQFESNKVRDQYYNGIKLMIKSSFDL